MSNTFSMPVMNTQMLKSSLIYCKILKNFTSMAGASYYNFSYLFKLALVVRNSRK